MESSEITFDFYYNEYNCGQEGLLPVDKFNYYITKAWRVLDALLTSEYSDEHSNAINKTVCEIAEELYQFEGRKGVKSESVDGYSVTFADEIDIRKNVARIASRRLGDTGLLYLGVD